MRRCVIAISASFYLEVFHLPRSALVGPRIEGKGDVHRLAYILRGHIDICIGEGVPILALGVGGVEHNPSGGGCIIYIIF